MSQQKAGSLTEKPTASLPLFEARMLTFVRPLVKMLRAVRAPNLGHTPKAALKQNPDGIVWIEIACARVKLTSFYGGRSDAARDLWRLGIISKQLKQMLEHDTWPRVWEHDFELPRGYCISSLPYEGFEMEEQSLGLRPATHPRHRGGSVKLAHILQRVELTD